jgi:hypothetical protein
MNGGGGNLYCFDVAAPGSKAEAIFLWDHEASPEQRPLLVADSFSDWMLELLSKHP